MVGEDTMSPKISIIIPVYNTEKYLSRCVDSVIAQTFLDIEIILVDDGSTDGSGKICDEFAVRDARVHVIHQQNAGVSAARNAGIDAATGEWIGFVDSDDWIDKETYEVAYDIAIDNNIDLVQWRWSSDDNFFSDNKFFDVASDRRLFESSTCVKLFRRSIITENNIYFPKDIPLSEDKFFSFEAYLSAKRCFYLNKEFYHYYARGTSASHNITVQMVLLEKKGIEKIENYLQKNNLLEKYADLLFDMKKECKNHAVLYPKKVNCNFVRNIFPEINKPILKIEGKKKIIYLLLYLHFDLLAVVLLRIRKFTENRKIASIESNFNYSATR